MNEHLVDLLYRNEGQDLFASKQAYQDYLLLQLHRDKGALKSGQPHQELRSLLHNYLHTKNQLGGPNNDQ